MSYDHCKELPGFKYKHRDVLFYIFKRTGVGGKHACRDLTRVSPLIGLGVETFTIGQTPLKTTSSKVAKHEEACSDDQSQHAFIHLLFTLSVSNFWYI
jgi:hypothetical protein